MILSTFNIQLLLTYNIYIYTIQIQNYQFQIILNFGNIYNLARSKNIHIKVKCCKKILLLAVCIFFKVEIIITSANI
jgi:hypothetical protein